MKTKLIALRLSRPAEIFAWGAVMYVAYLHIFNFTKIFVWLRTITFGTFTLPSFLSLDEAIGLLISIVLMPCLFLLVNGVKRHSKIMLRINFLLISFIYLGIASLCIYGAYNLPTIYAEQEVAGANKALLVVFVCLVGATFTWLVVSFCKRWYLHLLATRYLLSSPR